MKNKCSRCWYQSEDPDIHQIFCPKDQIENILNQIDARKNVDLDVVIPQEFLNMATYINSWVKKTIEKKVKEEGRQFSKEQIAQMKKDELVDALVDIYASRDWRIRCLKPFCASYMTSKQGYDNHYRTCHPGEEYPTYEETLEALRTMESTHLNQRRRAELLKLPRGDLETYLAYGWTKISAIYYCRVRTCDFKCPDKSILKKHESVHQY